MQESAFEQKKEKLWLKFNPGLALIVLRTTGPWSLQFTKYFISDINKENEDITGLTTLLLK